MFIGSMIKRRIGEVYFINHSFYSTSLWKLNYRESTKNVWCVFIVYALHLHASSVFIMYALCLHASTVFIVYALCFHAFMCLLHACFVYLCINIYFQYIVIFSYMIGILTLHVDSLISCLCLRTSKFERGGLVMSPNLRIYEYSNNILYNDNNKE